MRFAVMIRLLGLLCLAITPPLLAAPSEPADVTLLWPDGPPGGLPDALHTQVVDRGELSDGPDRAIVQVTEPTLSRFVPSEPNGVAVMLIPGGGYRRVVVDKEGFETARWLAERGFTAYVLLYRLPDDAWTDAPDVPLQDAQRGLRLIRSMAAEHGVDPQRIGILGFSAGGHLAASLATRFGETVYPASDAADALSARPDFAAMAYPVITLHAPHAHAGSVEHLLGSAPSRADLDRYSPHIGVSADTPPSFLLHAADDASVPVDNSLLMYDALRAAGVPVTMHLFARGGHGFGLRIDDALPVTVWPQLFADWVLATRAPQ